MNRINLTTAPTIDGLLFAYLPLVLRVFLTGMINATRGEVTGESINNFAPILN